MHREALSREARSGHIEPPTGARAAPSAQGQTRGLCAHMAPQTCHRGLLSLQLPLPSALPARLLSPWAQPLNLHVSGSSKGWEGVGITGRSRPEFTVNRWVRVLERSKA